MQSQTSRKVLSIIQRIFFLESFENKLQICCSITLNMLVYISHIKFSKIPPNQKIIIDILLVAHYSSDLTQVALIYLNVLYSKIILHNVQNHTLLAVFSFISLQSKFLSPSLISMPLAFEEYRPVILQNISSIWVCLLPYNQI